MYGLLYMKITPSWAKIEIKKTCRFSMIFSKYAGFLGTLLLVAPSGERVKELKNKAATSGTNEEINALNTKRTNNERSRRERETIRSLLWGKSQTRRLPSVWTNMQEM